ncbi:MAG: hypothetical protein COB29_13315 [Sulfitobacter sp.]|nr:MAG: hypothetical protein COB29_13315 [Sulfitobacter sp.]
MNPIRKKEHFHPWGMNVLDAQGHILTLFLSKRVNKLTSIELDLLKNKLCTSWMFHIVDVTADEPQRYRFDIYDQRTQLDTDLTGMQIGELDDTVYFSDVMHSYSDVKLSRVPQCTLETIASGNSPRSFIRFISPLNFMGNASKIIVCTKYQAVIGAIDVVGEKLPTTSQQVKSALSTVHDAFQRAITGRFVLEVNGFKSIGMSWDSGLNNLAESLANNEVNTLLNGNSLS